MKKITVKYLFLFFMILMVSACTFKGVYNRLDYLIPEYIESLVSLDDELEENLQQRTLLLITWHRNTQLVQYAEWMRKLQPVIVAGISQSRVKQEINQIEKFWKILQKSIHEELIILLPLLNEQQLVELFISLEASNNKFSKQYIELNEGDRIEENYEHLYDSYEGWTGDITDDQDVILKQAAEKLVSTAEYRLQRRKSWQAGVKSILQKPASVEIKSTKLREFFNLYEQTVEEASENKIQYNQAVIGEVTEYISQSMRQKQAEYFIAKTDDYIKMLTELSENR